MKKLIVLTIMFLGIQFAQAQSAQSAQSTQPKLMIVKFHADWCGSCRAMGPVLEDLTNKLDGTPVLFVELDFTNNTTRHQANLLANALGIGEIVKNNNATGFLLVIDSKTKEVKAKLTKEQTVKEMVLIIETQL